MTGRPSLFTDAIAETICERLANGESLLSICRSKTMPDYSTVKRWLVANEAFRASYVSAREDQADADADKIGDIAAQVLMGKYEPQAARVAIDALKWTAGKRQPKKYGDKLAIGGTDDLPPIKHEISAADILGARLDAIAGRAVSDPKPE